ncbi:MAG: phosphoribosyltransferase family protein [Saprospiraceae bacterium]
MQILNQHQIEQKIKRLAIQILEQNYKEKEIILAGINNNGMGFAKLLHAQLQGLTEIKITLTQIKINPANPLSEEITIGMPIASIKNKVVIIVDDVANTGRTLFYATQPLMEAICKKIEIAVLVERHHKSFPVMVEYVGISLNTTLKEDIDVQIPEGGEWGVELN